MKKSILKSITKNISSILCTAVVALSVEAKLADTQFSQGESRKTMAELHSKMAECLKSDKPMNECRNEMMSNCHDKMARNECQMMGMGGGKMMSGRSGAGGMMDTTEDKTKTK